MRIEDRNPKLFERQNCNGRKRATVGLISRSALHNAPPQSQLTCPIGESGHERSQELESEIELAQLSSLPVEA